MSHLVLVDASGYIYRAFHALPPLHMRDGTMVNGIFGFTQMLLKLRRLDFFADRPEPTHLIACLDRPGPSFRKALAPSYKAHRVRPSDGLRAQLERIPVALAAFGVPSIGIAEFEADDVIATLAMRARERGMTVTIVGQDKDLYQLVNGSITIYDPVKARWLDGAAVWDRYGVPPRRMADLQALIGDPVDNVEGIPGVGEKTAARWLETHGTLAGVIDAAENGILKPARFCRPVADAADRIDLARQLVKLRTDAPLDPDFDFGAYEIRDLYPPQIVEFCHSMEFATLAQRIARELAPRGI